MLNSVMHHVEVNQILLFWPRWPCKCSCVAGMRAGLERTDRPVHSLCIHSCTDVQANQVPIEARHCNLLLGLFAKTGNAKLADKTLKDMESGALAQPNAASFEYMAEVMLHALKYVTAQNT